LAAAGLGAGFDVDGGAGFFGSDFDDDFSLPIVTS
jgi:hypothetical protein